MVSMHHVVFGFALFLSFFATPSSAGAHRFRYVSYKDVVSRLHTLARLFPEQTELYSAQERFGLPSAGDCGSEPCAQWFLRVRPVDGGSEETPQVFFSGNLHGNEELGPQATLAVAELMLASTICEAGDVFHGCANEATRKRVMEGVGEGNGEVGSGASWWALSHRNSWLRELSVRRDVVFLVVSNAVGYYHNVREELGIDPNRDFPVHLGMGGSCMQTVVARAINEEFRLRQFVTAITFHGGQQAIAYEWGVEGGVWSSHKSPDLSSQAMLAEAMREAAGKMDNKEYPTGSMIETVYGVNGGMEDWAYAASWDAVTNSSCKPTEKNGQYPEERTRWYPSGSNRAAMFLIEMADSKKPGETTLGTDVSLLQQGTDGDGHVPRNVRLSLPLVDMAEPWVQVFDVVSEVDEADNSSTTVTASVDVSGAFTAAGVYLAAFHWPPSLPQELLWSPSSSVTSSVRRLGAAIDGFLSGKDAQNVVNDDDQNSIWIREALRLDETELWRLRDLCSVIDGNGSATGFGPLEKRAGLVAWTEDTSPINTRWNKLATPVWKGPIDEPFRTQKRLTLPPFNISVSAGCPQPAVVLLAGARDVDKAFSDPKVSGAYPTRFPQTHLARARRDGSWLHRNGDSVVRGRTVFVSTPRVIPAIHADSLSPTPSNPSSPHNSTIISFEDPSSDSAAVPILLVLFLALLWIAACYRNAARNAKLARVAGRRVRRCNPFSGRVACGCFEPVLWGPQAGGSDRPRSANERLVALQGFLLNSNIPNTATIPKISASQVLFGAPAASAPAPGALSPNPALGSNPMAPRARTDPEWQGLTNTTSAEAALGAESSSDDDEAPSAATQSDWMQDVSTDPHADIADGGNQWEP